MAAKFTRARANPAARIDALQGVPPPRGPSMLRHALLFRPACDHRLARVRRRWGPLVDVDLVDRDTGQWLPETPHRGDIWVAGTPGHRYAVRLTNTTGERVLVVLSVDGVNAVTGRDRGSAQAGYVLAPWQSTEIAGWRKSMDDVAQFVFTDLPDSYAARTGRPRNVGVVGVAVFREARPVAYERRRLRPPRTAKPLADAREAGPRKPRRRRPCRHRRARECRGEADAMQRQTLGTGHGPREWSQVADRVRARDAFAVAGHRIALRRRASLIAMGVLPRPRTDVLAGGAARVSRRVRRGSAALVIEKRKDGAVRTGPSLDCIPAAATTLLERRRSSLVRISSSVLAVLGLVFDLVARLRCPCPRRRRCCTRQDVHGEHRHQHQARRALHGRTLH
jgi:hypothetical protein